MRETSREVVEKHKISKRAFSSWKRAGRPGCVHPITKRDREAKRQLRKQLRKEEAVQNKNLLEDLMPSTSSDPRLFH